MDSDRKSGMPDPSAQGGQSRVKTAAPPHSWAIVAVGSNLGNPSLNVARAIERLQNVSAGVMRKSSLWKTEPVDCPPDSNPFINAVVAFEPAREETPETLLGKLQAIEVEFGRRPRQVLNEPRSLDLDLIAFGSETRHTPVLTLPHPRATRRAFVLCPLNEILPNFVLPGASGTVAELVRALPSRQAVRRLHSG